MSEHVEMIREGASPVVSLEPVRPHAPSTWKRARRSLVRARWPIIALNILAIVALAAVLGPEIAPRDPNRQALTARLRPPMQQNAAGEVEYILGTDGLGRDVLSLSLIHISEPTRH